MRLTTTFATALMLASPVFGHHSDAGLDMESIVTFAGTVTEFAWRNPHVYFTVETTDARGEQVVRRRVGPGDFLATVYHHLGIDAENVALPDFSGRPVPILPGGKPIPELLPRS